MQAHLPMAIRLLWVNCGMKYSFLLFFLLPAFTSFSQTGYADSLYTYQANYKKDLFDIIHSDTAGVSFYAPNAAFRVLATVQLLPDEPFFPMRTSDGKPKQAKKYAEVTFTLLNRTHKLIAYQLSFLLNTKEYKDNFFIPFMDAGSGEETYGGGRYLDFVTGDVINNTLLIDFNKAYNPYCAFTPGYSCPIPPRENILVVNVAAGEKQFVRPKK